MHGATVQVCKRIRFRYDDDCRDRGYSFRTWILCLISGGFFPPNATTCPCGLRGPPSWAWQECNRLLRLGRP